MATYYEFGGGLGDVLNQCYQGGCYASLEDLQGPADVVIISANPYAHELFSYHPKRHFMRLRCLPYWTSDADAQNRELYRIPPLNHPRPTSSRKARFFPFPQDEPHLANLPHPYAVIAASAGLPDRDLPRDLVIEVMEKLLALGVTPVLTGRTFERWGRAEGLKDYQAPGVVNLIDRLSVPGTCQLVQKALAVVTCHSSLNIIAWHERRPQLLLYPESVRIRHFLSKDNWSFGMDYPETFQATLGQPDGVRFAMTNFFAYIRELQNMAPPLPPLAIYPEEATRRELTAPTHPLTPAWDVRLLLHYAAQTTGAIVEIGCNRGHTTLEIAMAFPDRVVYAVDYPWVGVCVHQEGEKVPAQDFCAFARARENVVPIFKPIEWVRPEAFANVGCVFIDGNHTYDGCKRDTEIALRILQNGGLIAWHDCYEGAPAWVGVAQVVAERAAANPGNVWRVENSWMAFETVSPSAR